MSASTELSEKALLEFLVANKATVLETSEENILFDIQEVMKQQIIAGDRLLGIDLAWDAHWDCVGMDDSRFINTDDEFSHAPETTFRVNADGRLSGGPDDLAELRRTISQCLEDFIDTLRERVRVGP